jgi:hypothetical protein
VLGSASFISLVVLGLIVFDQSIFIIRSKSRCQAISQQRRERESAVLLSIVLVASLLLPSHSGPGRSTAGPRSDFHPLEGALPENLENENEAEEITIGLASYQASSFAHIYRTSVQQESLSSKAQYHVLFGRLLVQNERQLSHQRHRPQQQEQQQLVVGKCRTVGQGGRQGFVPQQ